VAALISLTLPLGGCADAPSGTAAGPSPSAGPSATPSVSALPSAQPPAVSSAPAPTVREVAVAVADGAITPAPGNVEVAVGEPVRLVVTSDTPEEVHVHGVDITGPVGPGAPFQTEFVPTQSGSFEVELHGSGALLFQLLVR
jgi:hypothetical protein